MPSILTQNFIQVAEQSIFEVS